MYNIYFKHVILIFLNICICICVFLINDFLISASDHYPPSTYLHTQSHCNTLKDGLTKVFQVVKYVKYIC